MVSMSRQARNTGGAPAARVKASRFAMDRTRAPVSRRSSIPLPRPGKSGSADANIPRQFPCATARTAKSDPAISIVRHITRPLRTTLAVSALGLVLTGCGLLDKSVKYACPQVFLLDDARDMTKFKPGPGRDITDILFEAEIVNFVGDCDYDEGQAEIELSVQIRVERGPANKGREIAFEYFVAFPKYESQSEGKSVFNVVGAFEGNRTRMIYRDDLEMTIPVKVPTDGAALEIVLGFQLTPEELKFNRSRKQR